MFSNYLNKCEGTRRKEVFDSSSRIPIQNFGGREVFYNNVDKIEAILVSSWCRVQNNNERRERLIH